MTDTIADAKIKITLVYAELDPEKFVLEHNHRRLRESDTIMAIVRNVGANNLTFVVQYDNWCCRLI